MFSWLVSSPFAIIHVDLWMTGPYNDSNGYMTFMNIIYDMSQFVGVAPVPDKTSSTKYW